MQTNTLDNDYNKTKEKINNTKPQTENHTQRPQRRGRQQRQQPNTQNETTTTSYNYTLIAWQFVQLIHLSQPCALELKKKTNTPSVDNWQTRIIDFRHQPLLSN